MENYKHTRSVTGIVMVWGRLLCITGQRDTFFTHA